MPWWEITRSQLSSVAIHIVGPKEIAKEFGIKETLMSRKGTGCVATNGSGIREDGRQEIVDYTESGEAVGMRSRAGVRGIPVVRMPPYPPCDPASSAVLAPCPSRAGVTVQAATPVRL